MARDDEGQDAAADDDPDDVGGDDQGNGSDQGSDQEEADQGEADQDEVDQDDDDVSAGSNDPDADEDVGPPRSVTADTIRAVIAQFEADQTAKAQGINAGVRQAAAAAIPPPNIVRPAILRPPVLTPPPRHQM